MNVGDKISMRPRTFGSGIMEGKVAWIHPQNRYAVAEFTIHPQQPRWGKPRPPVVLREAFLMFHRATEEDEREILKERMVRLPKQPSKW